MKGSGKRKLQTRVVHRSSKLKTLTRSIGRLNYGSIARQAMKVEKIRSKVLTILALTIQKELTEICAKKNLSLFRDAAPDSVKSFSWGALIAELENRAPIFTQVLRGIVQVKRRTRVSRTPRKKGKKPSRPSDEAIIGVCAAVMLRHRNVHMNLVQRIISLVLHNGHASKQVLQSTCWNSEQ